MERDHFKSSSLTPWSMSPEEIARVCRGQVLCSAGGQMVGVGTDTRLDLQGQLFIALKGDTHDGHSHLREAVLRGAGGLLVHKPVRAEEFKGVAVILVPDTLKALQDLARHYRQTQRFYVGAVSGSSGKTTTKEFLVTLLEPYCATFASPGSFNNHWGVPLSLLKASREVTHVVLEMGMNHAGELSHLSSIAHPDVVGLTMVGRAHVGELGSQEAVALAKEEIYSSNPESLAVFNLDNEWTLKMHERARHQRKITFSSFRDDVDVTLQTESIHPQGMRLKGKIQGVSGELDVAVVGRQNVTNLMAAAAMALGMGLKPEQIWSAMGQCQVRAWGRNQIVKLKSGATVVFDAYNANPESMAMLIRNLEEWDWPGRKILILGEMKELGSFSEGAHEELGKLAGCSTAEWTWFMGQFKESFERGFKASGSTRTLIISSSYDDKLAHKLRAMLQPSDLVGIKGSRGMKMEQVLLSLDPLNFSASMKPAL